MQEMWAVSKTSQFLKEGTTLVSLTEIQEIQTDPEDMAPRTEEPAALFSQTPISQEIPTTL